MEDKIKILMLEDVLTDLELNLFEIQKTKIGFEYLHVETEEDFRKGLIEYNPDLILSDFMLPQFTGMDALLIAKEISPLIPFIIVTGSMNEEVAVECMKAGADDYVIKDNLSHLGPAISSAMEKKALVFARKSAEEANRESQKKFQVFFDDNPLGVCTTDTDGIILYFNKAFENMLGYAESELLSKRLIDFSHPDDLSVSLKYFKEFVDETRNTSLFEKRYLKKDGSVIWVNLTVIAYKDKQNNLMRNLLLEDITQRKTSQQKILLMSKILGILNRPNDRPKLVKDILIEIKNFTHFEAVAIRLKEGEDYPYFASEGFPQSFINKERYLCARDEKNEIIRDPDGKACLECMCGNIISGRYDPAKNMFTNKGSFWSNGTTELLASTTDEDRLTGTRNYCNKAGYESVALVPIISGVEIIGLLQFNDKRPNMFQKEIIEYFEEVGATIGIAFRRMQNEISLKENKERFRLLFDNAPLGYQSLDQNGNFIDVNQAWLDTLGYEREEVIGKWFGEFLAPEYKDAFRNRFPVFKAEGKIHSEFEMVHKNGLYRSIAFDGKIGTDLDGNFLQTHCILKDITDLKRAEERSITLIRAIEQNPISVVITDPEGRIQYVNPKFEALTGYSLNEIIGKTPRILKSGYQSNDFYENLWDTLLAGNNYVGEMLNKKKTGELYWENAVISPIVNEQGDITNFVAVKEDITEKKKMLSDLIESKEKAESSNKLKDAFIANISHEIRTPLNGIVGMASLIRDTFRDHIKKEDEEMFDGIDYSSKRIIRTVDMILNYSRLQVGEFKIIRKNFSLSSLCESLVADFAPMAKGNSLEIIFQNNIGNTTIFADEYSIRIAVSNLIDNAVKYTNKGIINITLRRGEVDNIFLDITDTGIGIGKEYLEKMFEPYLQEQMGYGRTFEGVGLGLALVKKILDINDAVMTVESEIGKGSVFSINFGREVQKDVDKVKTEITDKIYSLSEVVGNKAVLIVEDDIINQLTIKKFLENKYSVFVADSADSAMEKLKKESVDLILMDISIKGKKNGLELTKELKTSNKFSRIPIIIVTAHTFEIDKKNAFAAGCDSFLPKPFTKDMLLNMIAVFVTKHK